MRWIELTVTTARESADAVAEKISSLVAGGVSLEESWDWEQALRDNLGDIFPDSDEKARDSVIIRGYLPLSFLARDKVEHLRVFLRSLREFGLQPATLACREVDDSSWEDAWKRHWQATPVGNKLLIVPAWQKPVAWPGRTSLYLDPGPAFGTGTHESTRLCLEFIESCLRGGETVLDLGCGSGILSLACGLFGASHVTGVDNDEAAVRFSRLNAILNDLEKVTFRVADLSESSNWLQLSPADFIFANLTVDLHCTFCVNMYRVLNPGGKIAASGIIRQRENEAYASFLTEGYRVAEKKSDGEWVAFLLEKR